MTHDVARGLDVADGEGLVVLTSHTDAREGKTEKPNQESCKERNLPLYMYITFKLTADLELTGIQLSHTFSEYAP
jgi:hypothetical protein